MTFYDDSPGPTQGERIELSRKVLENWVSKAANALQEGLDVQPGSVVYLDLPVPHWRYAYWALATWAVGATLTLDTHEGADVLVTTDQDSPLAEDADEVIVVSLAALARSFDGDLRTGVMDEAHELSSFGDSFTPWDDIEADATALVHDGQRTSYADLVPTQAWPEEVRLLVGSTDAATFLNALLAAFAARGSLVLAHGTEPGNLDMSGDRWTSEGVSAVLGPDGVLPV